MQEEERQEERLEERLEEKEKKINFEEENEMTYKTLSAFSYLESSQHKIKRLKNDLQKAQLECKLLREENYNLKLKSTQIEVKKQLNLTNELVFYKRLAWGLGVVLLLLICFLLLFLYHSLALPQKRDFSYYSEKQEPPIVASHLAS